MNVWIFQTGEPLHIDGDSPRPMRAMNLADALIEQGHSVTIWSSTFYHQLKIHRLSTISNGSLPRGLKVRLIHSIGYKTNISFLRLLDHFQLAFNLYRQLKATEERPDVAFIGFPPIEFAFIATFFLKTINVPTIIDIKDQWPQIFIDRFPRYFQWLVKLVLYPYFLMTRFTLRQTTAVSAITPEFLKWSQDFSKRINRKHDCVLPLSQRNVQYADEVINHACNWWAGKGVIKDERFRFCFVGSFSKSFDFETLVEVIHLAGDNKLPWQFVLCGAGDELTYLRSRLLGCTNVIFPGWINRPQMIFLASISDAGLAPYKNLPDFKMSIPNKIYDYLELGLPIITPLEGNVAQLITRYNVGILYEAGSAISLYNSLLQISNSKETGNSFANNLNKYSNKFLKNNNTYDDFVERLISISKYIDY